MDKIKYKNEKESRFAIPEKCKNCSFRNEDYCTDHCFRYDTSIYNIWMICSGYGETIDNNKKRINKLSKEETKRLMLFNGLFLSSKRIIDALGDGLITESEFVDAIRTVCDVYEKEINVND